MELNKITGILVMILGLIFIIFPMFSSELVSVIVGLSLLCFGIASIINALSTWNISTYFSMVNLVLGIIAIIFGVLFMFFIDAVSFLVGFQFYIIGFIMILFGIVGIISESKVSKLTSLIILLVGIVAIALAVFSVTQPIYAAILIGICLIILGLKMFIE